MDKNFEEIKEEFIKASLDEKIKIYSTTQGLTVEQFKELLAYFPIKYLDKLEEAVNSLQYDLSQLIGTMLDTH